MQSLSLPVTSTSTNDGSTPAASDVLKQAAHYTHNARVYKDETVFNTVQKMNELNRGGILVFNRDNTLAGLFTEQDFFNKILEKQKFSGPSFVSSVMTPANKLISVSEDTSLFECRKLMMRKNIRHLPVMSAGDSNAAIGIISMRDIIKAQQEDFLVAQVSETRTSFHQADIICTHDKGDKMWRKEAAMANYIKAIRKPIHTIELNLNDDTTTAILKKNYPNHLLRILVKGKHADVKTDHSWKDDISLEAFVLSHSATLPMLSPAVNHPHQGKAMGKNVQFTCRPSQHDNNDDKRDETTIKLLKQGQSVVWQGDEGTGKSLALQNVLMYFLRQMGKPGAVNHITVRIATSFFDIRYIKHMHSTKQTAKKKPTTAVTSANTTTSTQQTAAADAQATASKTSTAAQVATTAAAVSSDSDSTDDCKNQIIITCQDCFNTDELARLLKSRHDEYEATTCTTEASLNYPLSKVLAGKIVSIVDMLDENEPELHYFTGPILITATNNEDFNHGPYDKISKHIFQVSPWKDMQMIAALNVLQLADPLLFDECNLMKKDLIEKNLSSSDDFPRIPLRHVLLHKQGKMN